MIKIIWRKNNWNKNVMVNCCLEKNNIKLFWLHLWIGQINCAHNHLSIILNPSNSITSIAKVLPPCFLIVNISNGLSYLFLDSIDVRLGVCLVKHMVQSMETVHCAPANIWLICDRKNLATFNMFISSQMSLNFCIYILQKIHKFVGLKIQKLTHRPSYALNPDELDDPRELLLLVLCRDVADGKLPNDGCWVGATATFPVSATPLKKQTTGWEQG